MKLLKSFNNRTDAEVAKSFLESNGIKSFIIADDIGKMYPAASIYWGVKLFVNDKDFELADNLIEESSNDSFN
ncbi:MAG: DUF2007 domain-containing protein [Actinomycetota bacterium]|nr:DUF2007 domain-containing protein [Actinomycetota bacterium]